MDHSDKQVSRRQFMSTAIAAMGSLIGAVVAFPAIAYIHQPGAGKESRRVGAARRSEQS